MRWFWQLRRNPDTTEAERDLKRARLERERAERATEVTRSRWDQVHDAVADSRKIRKVNHIADDLTIIFRGHQ